MAKLQGIFKFTGTLGEVSAYKGQNGEINLRQKGGVEKSRIMNDPNFARTRENMSEFGKAASAGKLVRRALRSVSSYFKYATAGKVTKLMREKIEEDTENARGERTITTANLGDIANRLDIFKNVAAEVCKIPLLIASSGANISIGLNVTSTADFIPPAGATHYRVKSLVGIVKVEDEKAEQLEGTTGAWEALSAPVAFTDSYATGAVADDLVIGVAYIEFAQQVGGNFYTLGGAYFEQASYIQGGGGGNPGGGGGGS
ncbi:MAG: hypothetical protein AAF734_11860 [Bacteroidota bacterium]